jgi:hypothetical protein
VQPFPPVPSVENAPTSLFDGGHLWLQEWVVGGPLRFQLTESGLLAFGDDRRVFDDGDTPVGYERAVAHVRKTFDRSALRSALDDVSDAVFFGVATRNEGVAYDWDRTPPFLGVDVWTADSGFRPPDAAEALFDRLGLTPLNAVAKELRADSFDPGSYDRPESAYRDGPAAGVLVRNKTGDRATLLGDWEPPEPLRDDPQTVAEAVATDERIEAAAERVADGGASADVSAVTDRVVAELGRREYARLFGDSGAVDEAAFRSAVAERVSRVLGDA